MPATHTQIQIKYTVPMVNMEGQVRSGQVRSGTCTCRASCCSVSLSQAQVPAFAGSSVRDRKKKRGGGGGREGNVLFNDTLNTFYLWLYGVRHMVKDHSDSEKGNLLPPHRLLFPISSNGSFICTIPQTG